MTIRFFFKKWLWAMAYSYALALLYFLPNGTLYRYVFNSLKKKLSPPAAGAGCSHLLTTRMENSDGDLGRTAATASWYPAVAVPAARNAADHRIACRACAFFCRYGLSDGRKHQHQHQLAVWRRRFRPVSRSPPPECMPARSTSAAPTP